MCQSVCFVCLCVYLYRGVCLCLYVLMHFYRFVCMYNIFAVKCYACGSYDNNEWPTSTVEQCNTLGAINTHTTYCQYGCAVSIFNLHPGLFIHSRPILCLNVF